MTLAHHARNGNHPDDEDFHFEGFASPNTTAVPDEFFDLLAPNLSEAELRVLLYIIRRTFGFKKEADAISLKQMVEGITTRDGRVLDRGAGVAKSTAWRGIKGLVEKGIIEKTRNSSRVRGDEATTYTLRFRGPVFRSETPPVSEQSPPRVSQRNTQETGEQQTVRQENFELSKAPSIVDNSVGTFVPHVVVHNPPIANLIADFSREMGDTTHLGSNITQAHRIFADSRLGLDDYFTVLYEARLRTRKTGGVQNRMAYFFCVLRDLCGIGEDGRTEDKT
jgi:hypothetical protein